METLWNSIETEARWQGLVNGNVQDPVEGDSEGENLIFKKPLRKQALSSISPGYNFAGPGTQLAKRLKCGDKGINKLDEIALHRDIAYSKAKNFQDKWKADDLMIKAIDRLPGKKTMTEKVVKKIMQAKRKLTL